jgi:hypothetical protein
VRTEARQSIEKSFVERGTLGELRGKKVRTSIQLLEGVVETLGSTTTSLGMIWVRVVLIGILYMGISLEGVSKVIVLGTLVVVLREGRMIERGLWR